MKRWCLLLLLAGCGKKAPASAAESMAVRSVLAQVDNELLDHARSLEEGVVRDPKAVARQLAVLASSDRMLRTRAGQPDVRALSESEQKAVRNGLRARLDRIVAENTDRLAELLGVHGWFRISVFGADADKDAWILVDHADDPMLRRGVLGALELLWPIGETNSQAYAYLYDRVAVSDGQGQHYGTQGRCVAKGQWEPFHIEGEGFVDSRRREVGMGPLEGAKQMNGMTCE